MMCDVVGSVCVVRLWCIARRYLICSCVRFVSVICCMCLCVTFEIYCVMLSGVFVCVILCVINVCLRFNVFACVVCGFWCDVVCCVGVIVVPVCC